MRRLAMKIWFFDRLKNADPSLGSRPSVCKIPNTAALLSQHSDRHAL